MLLKLKSNMLNFLKKAQNLAKDNKDMEDSKFYVCPVCGYTVEINAPEKCPICGVKNEMFKEF